MKRSTTLCGTRQKSYVLPPTKRTFMSIVFGSYPTAEIADDTTRIISMSGPFDSDVVWKLHSIESWLLAHFSADTNRVVAA